MDMKGGKKGKGSHGSMFNMSMNRVGKGQPRDPTLEAAEAKWVRTTIPMRNTVAYELPLPELRAHAAKLGVRSPCLGRAELLAGVLAAEDGRGIPEALYATGRLLAADIAGLLQEPADVVRALAPSLGLHVPSSVPVEVLARLIAEKRQGAVRDSSQAAEIVYEAGKAFVEHAATKARAEAAAMKAQWPEIEGKLRGWAFLASTRA